jgi:hypothetical protein
MTAVTATLPNTLGNLGATTWWTGVFQIERRCTCKSRTAECKLGWHCVDSADVLEEARAEVERLEAMHGIDYRAVDSVTGKRIA